MLRVEIKNKFYKDKLIIKDFNCVFEKSEFISIIGPSGCGKSTILKIIAQVENNFEGKISFNNKKINTLGYIFQDSRLIPWLSVKDNIMLVCKKNKEKEVENLLEKFGLKDYVNSYIKELSGGMQRKVAMLRAFINKPDVLLLDEAFVSLDYPSAQKLRKIFFDLYNDYLPVVVFVTHDLSEALSMSNRILFLSQKTTNIILEYKNEATFDEHIINNKKEELFKKHPYILEGKL